MGNPLSLSLVLLFLSFADFGRGGVPTIKGQKGSRGCAGGEAQFNLPSTAHRGERDKRMGRRGFGWFCFTAYRRRRRRRRRREVGGAKMGIRAGRDTAWGMEAKNRQDNGHILLLYMW